MTPTVENTQLPLFTRIVTRGASLLVGAPVRVVSEPPRERYGHPSGMIRISLARSAALAEAARRSLHTPGAP